MITPFKKIADWYKRRKAKAEAKKRAKAQLKAMRDQDPFIYD